jgi:hypothetical protein
MIMDSLKDYVLIVQTWPMRRLTNKLTHRWSLHNSTLVTQDDVGQDDALLTDVATMVDEPSPARVRREKKDWSLHNSTLATQDDVGQDDALLTDVATMVDEPSPARVRREKKDWSLHNSTLATQDDVGKMMLC